MSEPSLESKTYQHDKDIALIKNDLGHIGKSIESLASAQQSGNKLLTEKVELMIGMTTEMSKVQNSITEVISQNNDMNQQLNKAIVDIDNIKKDLDPIKETVKNVDSIGFFAKNFKTVVFFIGAIGSGISFYVLHFIKGG